MRREFSQKWILMVYLALPMGLFGGTASPTPIPSPESPRLTLAGSKSSQFQYTFIEGGAIGFFTNGLTRRESLDLKLSGALDSGIKVLGVFQQSDELMDDKISLSLASRNWELYLGDLSAELPGAGLMMRPHLLSGGRFSGELGNFGWTAIVAVPKGQSRYLRVAGNGTQGPYPLGAAPIVPESEELYVDKVKMTRGNDYDVDYFNGYVIFKNRILQPHQLLEVAFQSRDTPFARQLQGLQLRQKLSDHLTSRQNLAVQWDGSELVAAPLAGTVTAQPRPEAHYALGQTVEYEDKRGKLEAEYAFSEINRDRNVGDFTQGHAMRSAMDYGIGAWRLKSNYKRSNGGFRPIAGADQGEDVLEYGGSLDFRPSPALKAAGSYDFSQRQLATGNLNLEGAKALLELSPKGMPWFKYQYLDETREDAAMFSSLFGPLPQRTRRHLGELGQDIGFGRASVQYEFENLKGQSSLQGVTPTPGLESNAAAGTLALNLDRLPWITAVLSGTYKAGQWQSKDVGLGPVDFNAREFRSDLSLRAGEFLTLSGIGQWLEASNASPKGTLGAKLGLRHGTIFTLESAYQRDSLQMFVFSAYEPADTQALSGSLNYSPWRQVNFTASGSHKETLLVRGGPAVHDQEAYRGAVKWAPLDKISLEVGTGRELFSLLNTSSLFLPLQSRQSTQSQRYGAKYALSNAFTLEAAYQLVDSDKTQASLLAGAYDRAQGSTQDGKLGINSALSQILRFNGGYSWKSLDQAGSSGAPLTLTAYPLSSLTQEAQNLSMQTFMGSAAYREEAAEAKLSLDVSPKITLGLIGAFASTGLRGQGWASSVVEGASVGLRFERLSGEIEYKAAQTFAVTGMQEQHHVSGNISSRPLDFLTASLRGEYTSMKDSQATRVTLNITESF